jgi:hypothetical protein
MDDGACLTSSSTPGKSNAVGAMSRGRQKITLGAGALFAE